MIPADGYLDPVAGHGTFIAGIIEQLAPGCTIRVEHVIEPLGDGRELDIVDKILAEARRPSGPPDIISMSFGGPVWDHAPALRAAIAEAHLKGIVLVASAGNDGVCVPQYPGAYDSVVAVGAVGPDGPPQWTNYGDWVDACAPGVDLVSSFFATFDGAFPMMNATDIDRFTEWATLERHVVLDAGRRRGARPGDGGRPVHGEGGGRPRRPRPAAAAAAVPGDGGERVKARARLPAISY